jgi:hypothetical protein
VAPGQRLRVALPLFHEEGRITDLAPEPLERFLREHQIAYTRISEGKYDCDPEWIEFRPPDRLEEWITNPAYEPIITASELGEVEQALAGAPSRLSAGEVEEGTAAVEEALGQLRSKLPAKVPPLETLEIVDADG